MSSNKSEELHEAQRLIDQRDLEERLLAALAVGLNDFERGNVEEWTPQLMDEIWREGKAAYEAGERPDSDICP